MSDQQNFNCTIRIGYYDLRIEPLPGIAQHTFLIAEDNDSVQHAFPCFGAFALREGHLGSKNVKYPINFWAQNNPWASNRELGRTFSSANLALLYKLGKFQHNPVHNFKLSDWYERWGEGQSGFSLDCGVGISVYGVQGTCHQACNRLIWTTKRPADEYSFVNCPPSSNLSCFLYWADGAWGRYGVAWKPALDWVKRWQGFPTAASDDNEALVAFEKDWQECEADIRRETAAYLNRVPTKVNTEALIELFQDEASEQTVDAKAIDKVADSLLKIHTDKWQLDKLILRGSVANNEYAAAINAGMQQLVEELQNLLPARTFKACFGNGEATAVIIPSFMPPLDRYQEVGKMMEF
jgi:hypothetical protein